MRDVGVPYTDDMIAERGSDALGQARPDTDAAAGVVSALWRGDPSCAPSTATPSGSTEMDALVAYLQMLGR